MKLGCCIGTNIDKAAALKKHGYDYAELSVNEYANLEESKFAEILSGMKETGISCEAACCFVPSEIKITEPSTDEAVIKDYVARAVYRSSLFGIKTIVFGSGGARKIPDGMPLSEGLGRIVSFLSDIAAPEADKYGIMIAIEPLRFGACNAINTVAQGVKAAEETRRANVMGLADVYHMFYNNDDLKNITKNKGKIAHAHTSYPREVNNKRVCPLKIYDDFDQYDFIAPLHAAGCPRLSVEAGFGADYKAEIAESLEVLKDALKRVLADDKD
jgi:D-psicose/D-tagatose/L-ribulose 3-epimerase